MTFPARFAGTVYAKAEHDRHFARDDRVGGRFHKLIRGRKLARLIAARVTRGTFTGVRPITLEVTLNARESRIIMIFVVVLLILALVSVFFAGARYTTAVIDVARFRVRVFFAKCVIVFIPVRQPF